MKVNVWGEDGQILVAYGHHEPTRFARAAVLAFAGFHGREEGLSLLREYGLSGLAQHTQCLYGTNDPYSTEPWMEWHKRPTTSSAPYTMLDVEGGGVSRDYIQPCESRGPYDEKCLRGLQHWGMHVGPNNVMW